MTQHQATAPTHLTHHASAPSFDRLKEVLFIEIDDVDEVDNEDVAALSRGTVGHAEYSGRRLESRSMPALALASKDKNGKLVTLAIRYPSPYSH